MDAQIWHPHRLPRSPPRGCRRELVKASSAGDTEEASQPNAHTYPNPIAFLSILSIRSSLDQLRIPHHLESPAPPAGIAPSPPGIAPLPPGFTVAQPRFSSHLPRFAPPLHLESPPRQNVATSKVITYSQLSYWLAVQPVLPLRASLPLRALLTGLARE
jgi:hypothetical protein